jgi:hypothetical protein
VPGDIVHRADATPAPFAVDERQAHGVAFPLIVPNQISNVITGIGVFTSFNLSVDPCAHRIRQGYVKRCHN